MSGGSVVPNVAPKVAVVFGPHPDDIEIGAGGTIAKLAAADWQVHLIILTDEADAGSAATRRDEAIKAAAVLGIDAERVHFCGFPDTQLSQIPSGRAIGQLREVLQAIGAYDLVIANGRADSHTDHKTAHDIAIAAVRNCPILLYPVVNSLIESEFHPRLFVNTTPFRAQKHRALAQHASQSSIGRLLDEDMTRLERAMAAHTGTAFAEGFELLIQYGAPPEAVRTATDLSDSPFHRFWATVLNGHNSLYHFYATPVLRSASLGPELVNYDTIGVINLNDAFNRYWIGANPLAGRQFPAQDAGVETLLETKTSIISGGATSNRFTDRYFNHFEGLRYVVEHTMPGYRKHRIHDRIAHLDCFPDYSTAKQENDTLRKDLGLLTVMRNPAAPEHFLIGCMGVHSPGSYAAFRVLSEPALMAEFLEILPTPVATIDPEETRGFQIVVEQSLPCEDNRPRLLPESLHIIR
ncbi:MAG: PIG-L deacetylase family protein [Kiloniellales bacterium]